MNLDRLIAEEKAAMVPPPGAKEATWSALEASIAAGAPAPIAFGSSIGWIIGIIGGASGLAVIAYVAMRPAIEAPPPAPPPPIVETVAPPPPPLPPAPIEEPKVPSRRPAKVKSKPSLAVQIAELRKAQLAFSRGGSEQALLLVAEHRKKFPQTPLEQERSALEALAACRLRREDGASLARAFLERWPESPQADRVARACGM